MQVKEEEQKEANGGRKKPYEGGGVGGTEGKEELTGRDQRGDCSKEEIVGQSKRRGTERGESRHGCKVRHIEKNIETTRKV